MLIGFIMKGLEACWRHSGSWAAFILDALINGAVMKVGGAVIDEVMGTSDDDRVETELVPQVRITLATANRKRLGCISLKQEKAHHTVIRIPQNYTFATWQLGASKKHLYSAELIREESKTTYCSAHVFVQLGTVIALV